MRRSLIVTLGLLLCVLAVGSVVTRVEASSLSPAETILLEAAQRQQAQAQAAAVVHSDAETEQTNVVDAASETHILSDSEAEAQARAEMESQAQLDANVDSNVDLDSASLAVAAAEADQTIDANMAVEDRMELDAAESAVAEAFLTGSTDAQFEDGMEVEVEGEGEAESEDSAEAVVDQEVEADAAMEQEQEEPTTASLLETESDESLEAEAEAESEADEEFLKQTHASLLELSRGKRRGGCKRGGRKSRRRSGRKNRRGCARRRRRGPPNPARGPQPPNGPPAGFPALPKKKSKDTFGGWSVPADAPPPEEPLEQLEEEKPKAIPGAPGLNKLASARHARKKGLVVKIPNPAAPGKFLKVRLPKPKKGGKKKAAHKAAKKNRKALKKNRKAKKAAKGLKKRAKKAGKRAAKLAKKAKKGKKVAKSLKKRMKKMQKKLKKLAKKGGKKAKRAIKRLQRRARRLARKQKRVARLAKKRAAKAKKIAKKSKKLQKKSVKVAKKAALTPAQQAEAAKKAAFKKAQTVAANAQKKELGKGNWVLKWTTIQVPDPKNPGKTVSTRVQVRVPGPDKKEITEKVEQKELKIPDPAHPGKFIKKLVEVKHSYKTVRQTVADPLNPGKVHTVDVKIEVPAPPQKPKAAFEKVNQVYEKHIEKMVKNIKQLKHAVASAKKKTFDSPILEDGAPAPPDRQEIEMAQNLYKVLDATVMHKAGEIRERYLSAAADQVILADANHENFDNFRIKMNQEYILPPKDW